jgi:hypothetical protein
MEVSGQKLAMAAGERRRQRPLAKTLKMVRTPVQQAPQRLLQVTGTMQHVALGVEMVQHEHTQGTMPMMVRVSWI